MGSHDSALESHVVRKGASAQDSYSIRTQSSIVAMLLCVVGVFAVMPTLFALWSLWTNDPLKSIGGLVPVVGFLLILRAWRALDWELNGSWWGVAILATIFTLVHLRQMAILEMVISPEWAIVIPPYSFVAVAYATGAVLLFGGKKLLSRTKFPVLLMWLVNPVPNFFSTHVDLPLQHASSAVARAFAHAMGQQLTSDQLLLMFTPHFGMFIAPGCNGIRGAVTMGMIALVAGYLYQFKPRVTAMVVAGAILLGYLFNFLRLCGLVLYYLVALHIPWLQTRATMGDYTIGAMLFAIATFGLFTVIRRLGATGDLWPPDLPREVPAPRGGRERQIFVLRCVAFVLIAGASSISYARMMIHGADHGPVAALGEFPAQVGKFHLVNRRAEYMPQGPLVFYWGDYANEAGDVVSIGVSAVLGAHDTLLCRSARGEDWAWHGNLPMQTLQGLVSFSGSFFVETERIFVEATTICTGESCGQYASNNLHFGFVYSVPKADAMFDPSPTRTIPVMLRAETNEKHRDPNALRPELTNDIREFLSQADLSIFTKPYRK